jgi:hypothetical protein
VTLLEGYGLLVAIVLAAIYAGVDAARRFSGDDQDGDGRS